MMIDPGEMTERIQLQRKARVRDGAGGATGSYQTYDTVWARMRPMRGGEKVAAQRQEGKVLYEVVVRNREDVREEDRILWEERGLNIRFVPPTSSREQFLVIEAELGARA